MGVKSLIHNVFLISMDDPFSKNYREEAFELNCNISEPLFDLPHIKKNTKKNNPGAFLINFDHDIIDRQLQLCESIHQVYKIPILFLTSETGNDFRIRQRINCSSGFIKKDASPELLAYAVDSAILTTDLHDALNQSNLTVKALLDVTNDMAMISDKDGRILYLNEEMAQYFGKPSYKLINRYYSTLMDANLTKKRYKQINKVFRTGAETHFTDIIENRAFDNHILPIKEKNGEVFRIAFYSRDITKDQIARARIIQLSKALENMHLGVTITDLDLNLRYCNKAEAAMHGYRIDELIGKQISIFLPEDYPPFNAEDVINIQSKPKERMNLRKNGEIFPVRIISDVVLNDEGVPFAFVTTCEDITEKRKLENQILRNERLAGVGSLAAGIAHEIRNPLGNISSAAQFCQSRDDLDENLILFLEIIRRNADLANKIIKDLIDFAKPKEMNKFPGLLNDIIKNILENLKPQINDRKIKINLNLSSDLPMMNIDAGWMNQVMQNLLLNAIEASVPEQEVTIKTELIENEIIVRIIDNGVGIKSENLSKVFDPFYTTKDDQVGLGMCSLDYVMTEHKAKMEISSEFGKGTEIVIHFSDEAILV